jgi:hypothetical protein
LQRDRTDFEMAEEVLARQARSLANRIGQPFDRALEIVADTDAGRQLRGLPNEEHRYEKAQHWQANVLWERAEEQLALLIASKGLARFAIERYYPWLEGYLEWLEGEEARTEYYARLEELASLEG